MTERPIMERLIKARDLIAQRGLARNGKFIDRDRKCFCSAGAIVAAHNPSAFDHPDGYGFGIRLRAEPNSRAALMLLGEVLGHKGDVEMVSGAVFAFNDNPKHSVDQVLLAFDKAIELARVRGV